MLGFIGIIAGVALFLAVVVSGLFIGTCLLVAWITDTIGGGSRRGQRGGGRRAGRDGPRAGDGGRPGPGVPVPSRQGYPPRDGSGVPVASRQGYPPRDGSGGPVGPRRDYR
jgi:hypothetical protein